MTVDSKEIEEMTTEGAIKFLKYAKVLAEEPAVRKLYSMCEEALRAQAEAERNEPLTLDELRRMDGEPVWIVFTPDTSGECLAMWVLVSVDNENDEIYLQNSIGGSSAYDEVWADIQAIYRRKPKDRETEGSRNEKSDSC